MAADWYKFVHAVESPVHMPANMMTMPTNRTIVRAVYSLTPVSRSRPSIVLNWRTVVYGIDTTVLQHRSDYHRLAYCMATIETISDSYRSAPSADTIYYRHNYRPVLVY